MRTKIQQKSSQQRRPNKRKPSTMSTSSSDDELIERKVNKIIGVINNNDKKFAFVKVDGSSEVHIIDLDALKKKYSNLLIDFYEKCLKWKKLNFLSP